MSRKDETCNLCNHPVEAHQPTCLVFMGDGEACECDGKEATTDKLTPEQRAISALDEAVARTYSARIEFESALADAFQRGKQECRREYLELLRRIVGAGGVPDMARALRDAEEELKKWGV